MLGDGGKSWIRSFIEEVGAKLVAINTENPPGREREAASFFAEKAAEQGLKAWLINHSQNRSTAVVELDWGEGPTLVFNSHLDTVPSGPVERWPFHPFQTGVKDGFLWGRGSVDAKGCLTSMLAAMAELGKSEKLRGRIVLMAVADEEVGGIGSVSAVKQLEKIDYIIVGEPTQMRLCVASRGRVEVAVEFFGKPAHASTPLKGVNAVSAAAKICIQLKPLEKGFGRSDRFLGRSSATVTMFEGGLKPNVVPDYARIVVDIRTTNETPEQVLDLLNKKIRRYIPGRTSYKTSITSVIPNYRVDIGSRLVGISKLSLSKSGIKPMLTGFAAATDLNRISRIRKVEGVILGPGDLRLAHSFEEKVAVSELVAAANVYKLIAEHLLA